MTSMYELDLDILNMYRLAKNKKFLGEVIRARTRQADRPMYTDRQTDRQTDTETDATGRNYYHGRIGGW